jgi:hypothetical protein
MDGIGCNEDCADCTVKYPSRFQNRYPEAAVWKVKPFISHILITTGKSDWTEKIEHAKGSMMEAFKNNSWEPKNGVWVPETPTL